MRAGRAVGATRPLVIDVSRVVGTLVNALWWAGAIFGLVGGVFVVGVWVIGIAS